MSEPRLPSATLRPRPWRVPRATAIVAALLCAALGVFAAWPTRSDLREFDPDRVARLDTEMWRSYYERRPVRLFAQLTHTLHEQYGMTFPRATWAAFHAARAAFVFKRGDGRTAYERARPALEAYYTQLRAVSRTPFDVRRAARTELEWWIVHREREHRAPGELSRALAEAAAALYELPPERFTAYADARSEAMTIRDERAASDGVSDHDWRTIEARLRDSWRALHDAVADQPGTTTTRATASPRSVLSLAK